MRDYPYFRTWAPLLTAAESDGSSHWCDELMMLRIHQHLIEVVKASD
jgi:hypothetical protein